MDEKPAVLSAGADLHPAGAPDRDECIQAQRRDPDILHLTAQGTVPGQFHTGHGNHEFLGGF